LNYIYKQALATHIANGGRQYNFTEPMHRV
jgi:hypothetical protein